MSAHRERALAALELKRWDELVRQAREGLAVDPEDAHLHALLSVGLLRGPTPAEAVPPARAAVALAPDDPWILQVAAEALSHSRKRGEALRMTERAVAIAPEDAVNHVHLADQLVDSAAKTQWTRQKRKLLDRAEVHAQRAMALDPSDPGGFIAMANVCLHRADADWARYYGNEALRRDPQHPSGHQVMGLAAEQDGDLRAASDHYVSAARLTPDDTSSLRFLRKMRRSWPVNGIVIYLIVRYLIVGGRAVSGAAAGAIFVLAAVVAVTAVVWPRVAARRAMSHTARSALTVDRQTRRSRRVRDRRRAHR